jgi:eukaryotic-like serine/threonine-protein kinase
MIKMSKTLTLMTIVISLITSILVTGLSATTFTQVVVAQGNSTSLETTSNSNIVPHLNSTTDTTTDSASSSFITYENSTWGIKIQYPSTWEKQTTGKGVTFIVLSNETNANSDKNLQQFLAKLNLTSINGIPPNAPIKALADRIIGSYGQFLHNFQIQSYTNTTLGGNNNNAIKIVYSFTDPKNINFNATDIATIKNDRLYVIQYYYTQSPKHQSYLPILQKMVDSFQIR